MRANSWRKKKKPKREEVDYFDQRFARNFWIYKCIVWGVPTIALIYAIWEVFRP